jgi:ABC-type nitrate/sulfonate/bicarbonate transport system substrate-binding protein
LPEEAFMMLGRTLFVVALFAAVAVPAAAEDVIVTQYKADPSGAPFAVGIDKGFFKKPASISAA